MVKILDREGINRMVSRKGSGGVGGGGGGSDIDLSSYATKSWTDENYVGKEFFSSLFKAYDANGNEVLPNDTETTIDNIKAMFGFWTDAYLSALGNNPGGGGAELTLASLADVAVQGVANGQALVWNAVQGKWVPGSGGLDLTAMWNALAANTNQQINASHLSDALSSYATQSWVTQQGYLTASAISDMATKTWVNSQISDMATKTWVGNNYLGLHATADAATKLATARTIWGQSFNGTANVSGDMSSVGDIALGNGKRIYNAAQGSGGSLYIGRSDDAGWVYMSDMCSRRGDAYWKVTSAGNATFANVLSNGYVTALSDIRKKNVIEDIELDVNAIALARLIRFTWKDRKFDKNEHVGGIAQEWQKILPEAVHESEDGTLSMDYGAIGMISAVTLARKVVRMESEVEILKKDIEKLKKQLNVV